MDAAINAAKDATDAMDDIVQHLSSAEAFNAAPVMEDEIVETIVNESTFAEPIVEELVEQMQESTQVPFFLIASTLALGVVVFLIIFLRRRRNRLVPCAKAPAEGVAKPIVEASSVSEATSAEAEVVNAEVLVAEPEDPPASDIVEEATEILPVPGKEL